MRECENAEMRDLLPDLVSGRITADARGLLEAHVRTCAACADELTLLTSIRGALSRAPSINVAGIAQGVASVTTGPAGVHDRRKQSRAVPTRLKHWKLAAAVAGIIIAGATAKKVADDAAMVPTVAMSGDTNPPGTSPNTKHPQVPTGTRPTGIDVPADMRDLSTEDLQQLFNDLQTMDAVPATEPTELVPPSDGGGVL